MTRITVQVTTWTGKPIEHADVKIKLMKGEKASTNWRQRAGEDGHGKGARARFRRGPC